MRLDVFRRLKLPASSPSLLLRAAWKYGLGVGVAAVLLTAGGVDRVQPSGHALASNVLPTTVPCGNIATDPLDANTATWTATKSPYPGTASPYNLPVSTTNNSDPGVQPCDAIVVPKNVTLKIDARDGPVQIFSHGAAIQVDGGHLLVLGKDEINSVLFDAEPDVASWIGITVDASDATHLGNASFAFASIQHALNSITITSGAISTPDPTNLNAQLPYGLALVNSGIGPSYFDGIDATDTPVSVKGQAVVSPSGLRADGKFGTVNNIGSQGINFNWGLSPLSPPPALPANALALKVDSVAFGSSVPFAETGCLPLQLPCSAGSIGNDAIVATFKSPNPPLVSISQSRFYRAGSFGIELNSPNLPIIKDNNFDCNGTGSPKPKETCVGTGLKYSAIYLNTATVDLENSVTNNVGHEDGLDAIVLNGTIVYQPGLLVSQQIVTWKNATNDPVSETHQLGYLLNGDLNLNSGTLKVRADGVVKSKGTINLTGAALDASETSNSIKKVFTSLRDNVNIPTCPSVFVQSCPTQLPAGEWGGINLVGSRTDATMRSATKSTIINANILYATTGVHITNGDSLVISGSTIGPTFADGVLAEGTPLKVTSSTFGCPVGVCSGPSSGNHGILADFRNSGPPTTGLTIGGPNPADKNTFQGSVNEAIRAVGLAGQPVVIERSVIQNAGAIGSAGSAGIYLQGADNLTLQRNDVVGSGTGNLHYPAIWLDGVSHADFGGPISNNTGSGNGLNAIAFHGDTKALTWQSVAASGQLGFIVDGDLLVAGDLTMKSNDYAPILAGTITVQTGTLTSTGATMTSLKEQTQLVPSCGSVFVPRASGVCSPASAGDWGGLVLDAGKTNNLTDSFVRYAATGISMSTPNGAPQTLTLSNTSITNTAADGLSTRWPVSITGGAFTSNGGHGIKIDLSGFAPSTVQSVSISGTAISGSGQEGILAVGLAGQTVTIDKTSVNHAGAFGINLKDPGKDAGLYPGIYKVNPGSLTLTSNTVRNTAATFPAIYLNGFFGAFAKVSGNTGAANGVDAIVFHGTVTDDLDWKTARKTGDPTMALGYLLDNTLTMAPPPPTLPPGPPPPPLPPPPPPGTATTQTLTVKAGDIVKVGNGGVLNLQNVKFQADDTATSSSQKVFTSMTDDSVGVATCRSAVVIGCAGAVQPPPQSGDWGGIVLTGGSANGAFVNAAVRYASTGIVINSGATSTSTSGSTGFGLEVSGSSIGPNAADGINAVKTAISVTTSSISGGTHGISVDLSGVTAITPLRLSGNRFVSTSAEAILGQALAGQPVWVADNRIQGAGTYGIRLVNANQLVLRNNNVAGSGVGPGPKAGRYPAIYLPAVSADFTGNIRGNVGRGNGLDALVFNGQVTGDLTWITPSNNGTLTHGLGYLLDGGVTLQGGKLMVGAGDVVKALGGPITINGGNITATGSAGGSPTSNSAIFTSLKDNPSAPTLPVDRSDAAAVSCPSVLVSDCSPKAGDWGGLVITSNAAGVKGSGSITYGLINYANTGISLDSGPIGASPEAVPANFRLTVRATTIENASKDGINSLDTPFSVKDSITMDPTKIQNVGANGIVASFFSPANCSSTTPPLSSCIRLEVKNVEVTGTGKDGIIANGLSGQPTEISDNTITDAGTYGIRLVGADKLTLTTNHVRKSAFASTALRYPAIYLSSVKADFEASGTGAIVQGNDGKWNGIDAIVFHGEATKKLTWITAVRSVTTDVTFGYLLDGPLVVDGDFVSGEGDIVKIMNGGISINGGGLKSAGTSLGTIFTSLRDNRGEDACHSVFIPTDVCPTVATNSDWFGISIDGANSVFKYGKLLYATSGVTINSATLKINNTLITGLGGYAVTTTGTGSALVDCASIHGNSGGISSNGAATTIVTYSNLYGNTTSASKDFDASVASTATSDWWGQASPVAPPSPNAQYSASVTVNDPLPQEKPTLKATSPGVYVTSDNTNANGSIGKGKLTVTFNREMNPNIQPVVSFIGPDAVQHPVAGAWNADNLSWTSSAAVDSASSSAGLNTMTVSQGTSCIPDGTNVMAQESRPFTLDFTKAVVAGTGGATGISETAATLHDSVNAQGWSKPSSNPKTATFAFFQLRVGGGSYDNSVASVVAGTVDPTTLPGYTLIGYGTSAIPVTFAATNLTPITSYDYRVVAFDLNDYTLGADQHFTTLDVVPAAPTAVTASPGNGKATVSWTPPLANGGTAISSYTVTASPGGANATTLNGSTTSIDVPGLTNGTSYTFTVVATNGAGSGVASSASAAITVGSPAAPGSPNAAAGGGAGEADLTWTVPADNGSGIVSYTVTPYEGATAGTPIVLLGSALTGTTVSGLISGHTYTFTVFATNGNGGGPVATTNAVTVS